MSAPASRASWCSHACARRDSNRTSPTPRKAAAPMQIASSSAPTAPRQPLQTAAPAGPATAAVAAPAAASGAPVRDAAAGFDHIFDFPGYKAGDTFTMVHGSKADIIGIKGSAQVLDLTPTSGKFH